MADSFPRLGLLHPFQFFYVYELLSTMERGGLMFSQQWHSWVFMLTFALCILELYDFYLHVGWHLYSSVFSEKGTSRTCPQRGSLPSFEIQVTWLPDSCPHWLHSSNKSRILWLKRLSLIVQRMDFSCSYSYAEQKSDASWNLCLPDWPQVVDQASVKLLETGMPQPKGGIKYAPHPVVFAFQSCLPLHYFKTHFSC